MKIVFAVLMVLHGAVHVLGFVKGVGLAEIARLSQPISRSVGALWLLAALGFIVTAALLFAAPKSWWFAAVPSLLLSQALIVGAWSDAKFGTVGNLLLLVPLTLVLIDLRPASLHSRYEREVGRGLERTLTPQLVTEMDLAPLPKLTAAYLRRVGVVGKPRVRNFRAVFRAQMRASADAPWMIATAEQFNFYDEPSRLFFMQASRAGLPFDIFHRYVGSHATMQVRIGGIFSVTDADGAVMDQSETVTMLNDLALLAPGALPFAPIAWEILDAPSVRATFTNAGHTVHGDLFFNASGDLIDFVSKDRFEGGGAAARPLPWQTPISEYGTFRGFHLLKKGEARWLDPSGSWTYGRFELVDVEYNVAR